MKIPHMNENILIGPERFCSVWHLKLWFIWFIYDRKVLRKNECEANKVVTDAEEEFLFCSTFAEFI